MVYSRWLSLELAQGLGHGPGNFRDRDLNRDMGYVPIFQVLKLFQVVCFNDISMAFRCPVLAPDTASMNGFCIILAPVPVLETASVNTPLKSLCSSRIQTE